MEHLFAKVFLGHLAGDYLLQTKDMALSKEQKNLKGIWACTIHCLVYTACICLFTWTVRPDIAALVFLSHFPIDRWSLGSKWLKLIKGRDMKTAFFFKEKLWEIDLIFSCIVYTVVDNTLHLILLYLIFVHYF